MILSVERFNALLLSCKADLNKKFAVAVSGGADSMVLAILAKQWSMATNRSAPVAISIDHKLRVESTQEVKLVGEWLKRYNMKHIVANCTWDDHCNVPRMQESARMQRYTLIQDICEKQDIDYVLVGHHADDQLETMLHRFGRGSGLHGLGGMASNRCLHVDGHVRMLRPFLTLRKKDIQQMCRSIFKQDWIEDPSNKNLMFDRVRIRKVIYIAVSSIESLD